MFAHAKTFVSPTEGEECSKPTIPLDSARGDGILLYALLGTLIVSLSEGEDCSKPTTPLVSARGDGILLYALLGTLIVSLSEGEDCSRPSTLCNGNAFEDCFGRGRLPQGIRKRSLIPQVRDADLRSDGLEVLRFTNADVLTNSEGVKQVIFEKAEAALKQNTK